MCEKEEKFEQIGVVLRELQKLDETDSLFKELGHMHAVLKSLIYDWESVVGHLVGLWENYANNPEIPEDQKNRVKDLLHQSVDALRKLSENKGYLQDTCDLIGRLIIK
ncbi:MAG: hypothetical protein NC410_07615 [Oscillibacter sp.]|nr:hypothetical protein [Oscillibacter sp.]